MYHVSDPGSANSFVVIHDIHVNIPVVSVYEVLTIICFLVSALK